MASAVALTWSLANAVVSFQQPQPWSCDVFQCTCQGMADYYGAIAGFGWGCAPTAAQTWWTDKMHCNTAIDHGNKSMYCKGPACSLPHAAPCYPPAPAPTPPPPSPVPSIMCKAWETDPKSCLSYYNVVWDNLIDDSGASTWVNTMPIGNGRFAANAFVNTSAGSINALISSPGAWSEAGELLKVGLISAIFQPNPFSDMTKFKQTFDVASGSVTVSCGDFSVTMRIAARQDVILITNVQGNYSLSTMTAIPIRTVSQLVTPAVDCYTYNTSADVHIPATQTSLETFYHRNMDSASAIKLSQSYFANVVAGQNLGPQAATAIPDGIASRTFGGSIAFSRTAGAVALSVEQPADSELSAWISKLQNVANTTLTNTTAICSESNAWWLQFHMRSHIEVSSTGADDEGTFIISRQFVLQRMMTAFQARMNFPIKFNGQLFTANRGSAMDTRQWGGLSWWQNLRSPYYSMLYTGDDDFLKTLIECFLETLPLAKARVEHYYNHSGAYWPEYTHPLFGTTHPSSYGCNRSGGRPAGIPIGYSMDRWNHYNVQGGLDLSLFILDHYSWTQDSQSLQKYLPIVLNVVEYYSKRWSDNGLDSDGKIIMFPTQAVETWQCPNYPPQESECVTNDTPTVAGLHSVLAKLLQLPDSAVPPPTKSTLQSFKATIPDIPMTSDSPPAVAAASKLPPSTSNVENPELYTLHPYRIYSAAQGGDLGPALRAFAKKRFPSDVGWNQVCADAALAGLGNRSSPNEAPFLVLARAATQPAVGYRFPSFMPHFQDYEPSADHLGIFSIATVWMLIQPKDDANGSAVLLPAWPCEWNVNFKVAAPRNTVVSGSLINGTLTYQVSPPERAPAISAANCQQ